MSPTGVCRHLGPVADVALVFLQVSTMQHGYKTNRFLEGQACNGTPTDSHSFSLNFQPHSLDGLFFDTIDTVGTNRQEQLLESAALADEHPAKTPSGVLCQTLLHPDLHDKHFLSFAKSGIGESLASKFDLEFQRQCKEAFTPEAYADLWADYTGSWKHDKVAQHDNLIFGAMGAWLNKERKATKAKTDSWNKFRNQDVEDRSEMEGLLRHIAQKPAITLTRILDFGCGDGVEISKIARGLGLGQADTFCLDITDYVAKEALHNVTKIIVPAETKGYVNALEKEFEKLKLRGTVSAVTSSVTFHHITNPKMRTAALKFIRESLAPGGFFLMAEWDNVGSPIDYTVYMDLVHFLPSLFFNDPAPTTAKLTPLDTEYLSVQGWISLMNSNGLPYDADRSRLPWGTGEDNKTIWLGPEEAAKQSSGRNFLAVFGK